MPHLSAIDQVTDAVHGALDVSGMTALATGGVYTNVPQAPTFPYVRVGQPTENRMDTMGRAGKTVSIQVHIFSDNTGPTQAAGILSKAIELLHYQALTVSGHSTMAVQYQTGFDAGDEVINGVTVYHYVAIFDVIVQQS
jgi:hypothetical protein